MESTNHAAQPEAPKGAQPVIFTDAAVAKIRHFLETAEEARGKNLRIFVQGGGCSGFEYGFTFDVEKEGDVKVPQGDIEVLVDMFSLPYLEGSQVDYAESLMGSGFTVTNPNAKGTCGCGHSFTA
jgi:iron-sulfur cluster insertion protein